jgi:hypothetical protein
MTEEEWLTAQISDLLLHFIEPKVLDRKLYYFDTACARRIAPLLVFPASSHAVEVLERFAEGQCGKDVFAELSYDVEGAAFCAEAGDIPWLDAIEQLPISVLTELAANPNLPVESTQRLIISAAYFIDRIFSPVPAKRRFRDPQPSSTGSYFQPVSLVHEVFGNPFRTVKFKKAWRTDTALSLARQMYESRDFGAMPILADALQDAGCDNDDVLNHCRDPKQVHVRGCWVVDLVLGKK